MSAATYHVLLIDDDDVDRAEVERLIGDDFQLSAATTAGQAARLLVSERFDGVLLDYRLPDVTGLQFLEQLVEKRLPVVMLTRQGSESVAVEAMKRGAKDYLVKGELSAEGLRSSLCFAIEQQSSEARLRDGEANVRRLFDMVADCIIAIDSGGTIVDLNSAVERVLGYRSEEISGKPVYDILRPSAASSIMKSHRPALDAIGISDPRQDQGRMIEFTATRKDGSTFIAEGTIQPIPFRGADVTAIFLHDVTLRKHAELELQKARRELEFRLMERNIELKMTYNRLLREMQERDQSELEARQHREELAHVSRLNTLGEMASGLAHELNQPLTAIVAHIEASLMALDSAGLQNQEIIDDLRISIAQARRAAEIIKRLRSLVGKQKSHRDLVDCRDLISEVVELLSFEADSLGIKVSAEHFNTSPLVLVDRIQIQQVLLNLIRNAMEAMKALEGERLVRVVTRRSMANDLVVQVIDTGPAVAPDQLLKLFEPFFTTKPNGLGLGLSISRSIIEAHEGKLTAHINSDRGLTVEFALPQPAPKIAD